MSVGNCLLVVDTGGRLQTLRGSEEEDIFLVVIPRAAELDFLTEKEKITVMINSDDATKLGAGDGNASRLLFYLQRYPITTICHTCVVFVFFFGNIFGWLAMNLLHVRPDLPKHGVQTEEREGGGGSR